jgi:SAM-dependent methyltransferase
MYLLSNEESARWRAAATQILEGRGGSIADAGAEVHPDLRAPFYYYVGTVLAASGDVTGAIPWLEAGRELEPIPACSYLLDLVERQGGEFVIPEVAFTDPRPWGHFSGLPSLREARSNFIERSTASLPAFAHPLRYADIGCGNGELGIRLARSLEAAGKVTGIGAVTLIDPSPGMLELAERNVGEAFPGAEVTVLRSRLEDAGELPGACDLSIASSSVHHMTAEQKSVHLPVLAESVDHFLLSELEANHDYPEMGSPELAFSVYQVFGRGVQWVMEQQAPSEVQRACADTFLMTEAISILSQPRGERTEYHMLRDEWKQLLDEGLESFERVCEATCYADEYVEQFMLHYARKAGSR